MTIKKMTTARDLCGTKLEVAAAFGNILGHEIIGLHARVQHSRDPTKTGIAGAVVDETRNTIIIEEACGKRIMLPKSESIFEFDVVRAGEKLEVDGKRMTEHPWERTKKLAKNLRKWR